MAVFVPFWCPTLPCLTCCNFGISNFDFIAGRSKIYGVKNQEDFLEANYIYGLNNLLTLYGGTILSDNYNAITLGNGWNTPLGAISFDATRSSSKLNNDITHEGTSYQVAYNKYLVQTATDLAWLLGVMLRRITGHSATIFTKMIK